LKKDFKVWALGDWHLQHFKLATLWKTRPLDYETQLLANYDAVIKPNHLVIFVGDMMFKGHISRPWFAHISQTLQGTKILIRGNHDYPKKFPDEYWINDCGFKKVYFNNLVLGNILFSHFPITRDPTDDRGLKLIDWLNRAFVLTQCDYNVHGHVHDYRVPDPKCICTCPEQTDYKPVDVTPLFKNLKKIHKFTRTLQWAQIFT